MMARCFQRPDGPAAAPACLDRCLVAPCRDALRDVVRSSAGGHVWAAMALDALRVLACHTHHTRTRRLASSSPLAVRHQQCGRVRAASGPGGDQLRRHDLCLHHKLRGPAAGGAAAAQVRGREATWLATDGKEGVSRCYYCRVRRWWSSSCTSTGWMGGQRGAGGWHAAAACLTCGRGCTNALIG